MTDRDLYCDMLNRAQVPWDSEFFDEVEAIIVRVNDQPTDKRVGYKHFYAEARFAIDGRLLAVGAWEE